MWLKVASRLSQESNIMLIIVAINNSVPEYFNVVMASSLARTSLTSALLK